MLSYTKQLKRTKERHLLYFSLYHRRLPSGTPCMDQLISGLTVQGSQGSAVSPQVGTKNAHNFRGAGEQLSTPLTAKEREFVWFYMAQTDIT